MQQTEKKFHKLVYYRKLVGINQKQMAKLLGYTQSNYCNKESGRTTLNFVDMTEIRNIINKCLVKKGKEPVTLDEIFLD